jgi:hypothetical protein
MENFSNQVIMAVVTKLGKHIPMLVAISLGLLLAFLFLRRRSMTPSQQPRVHHHDPTTVVVLGGKTKCFSCENEIASKALCGCDIIVAPREGAPSQAKLGRP